MMLRSGGLCVAVEVRQWQVHDQLDAAYRKFGLERMTDGLLWVRLPEPPETMRIVRDLNSKSIRMREKNYW